MGVGLVDITEKLGKLIAKVKSLQRKISAAEEELDEVLWELLELEREIGGSPAVPAPGRARRVRSREEEILKLMAEAGVATVDLVRLSDSTELHVDGGRSIRLTHRLAGLMEILIEERASDDGLVGWKSLDEVGALLGRTGGAPLRRHAVNHLLYRLRVRLRASGENPFLVQLRKGTGVRFALRRKPAAARERKTPTCVTFGEDGRSEIFLAGEPTAGQGADERPRGDHEE
jgi:hypothetical protein